MWPALEDEDFRLPTYKRITFALGGPVANMVAAFVGLLVIGLSQFGLPATQALSFAATHLLLGLQQQLHGLSTLFADWGQMSGIIGIVAVGGAQFGATWANLLTFSVLVNISLAVLNLLPLPPLDGGRVVFCVLEKLYRPVAKVEAPVTLAGWALLYLTRYLIIHSDDQMCDRWAQAINGARLRGRPIAPADAWVAATALLLNVPLVTHNGAHYSGIDGLRVISGP